MDTNTEISRKQNEKKNDLSIWNPIKERLAVDWYELSEDDKNIQISQGDVFFCKLGENIGHEQKGTRPVLVISDGRYSSNGQAVVIPLTECRKKPLYTQYKLCKTKNTFLDKDSTVRTEQIRSVSTSRLTEYKGKIDDQDLKRIKIRLINYFNL